MHPQPRYFQDGLPDRDLDAQFYEGVALKRLWAWIADFIVIFALSAVAVVVFGVGTLGLGFFAAPLVAMVTGFVYRWFTISQKSATWGMRLVGIEFRNHAGERFDSQNAAIHTALFSVAVMSGIGQLISVILMIGTSRGQGLHDMVMGSAAINRPAD